MQAVKTVEDSEGVEAWWEPVHRRAPRSMARAVRLVGLVASLPKMSNMTTVEAEIRGREDHQKTLAREVWETFLGTVKVGVLFETLPKQAHDVVLQVIGNDAEYEEIVERVRMFVVNNVDMMSGSERDPVDVGQAHAENYGERGGEEDVGNVSMNAKCQACQGWGHVRRDCPTAAANSKRAPERRGKGRGPRERRMQRRQGRGKRPERR